MSLSFCLRYCATSSRCVAIAEWAEECPATIFCYGCLGTSCASLPGEEREQFCRLKGEDGRMGCGRRGSQSRRGSCEGQSVSSLVRSLCDYTGFRLYGHWIYGLYGFILVIYSMVNHILILNFMDIWSFRLYGQLYQDKTVDHISETRCKWERGGYFDGML